MSKIITDSNQMLVTSNVLAPPTEVLYIYPVKDMFVTQTYPVFSFGQYAELYVRKSSTDECKTIMSFNIPALNRKVWENIIYSKLKISFREVPRATKIALRRVVDDGWSEMGLTWAGQPEQYPDILATYDIDEKANSIYLDFKPFLVQAEGEAFNFSFSIEEVCDKDQDSDINICSKESYLTKLKPQIITEYEYFPDNYDIADLNLSFAIKAYDKKDLRASVTVMSGNAEEDLPATVKINQYDDQGDLNASIYTAAVTAAGLSSSVVVRRYSYNNLPGKFRIPLYENNKDIDVSTFKVHVPKYEMPASLTLTRKDVEADLAAPGFGVKKDAEAELNVEFGIKLYSPNADLDAYIAVKDYGTAELEGNIKVNGYEAVEELSAEDFVVKANDKADIEASIIIPYHKVRADLRAEFAVAKVIPTVIIPPEDDPGTGQGGEGSGSGGGTSQNPGGDPYNPGTGGGSGGGGGTTVNPQIDEDEKKRYEELLKLLEDSSLNSSLTVRSYDAEADLDAMVTVISRADLPALDFGIKSYYKNADINTEGLFVLPYVGFPASFAVRMVEDAYIDASSFRVRPSWAKDMTAKVKVVKDPRKPYAFIM